VALKKGSAALQQHLLSARGMLRLEVTKLLSLGGGEEPFISLAPVSISSSNQPQATSLSGSLAYMIRRLPR